MDRIMRLGEVMQVTGIGRSRIYDGQTEGTFPRSIKLGARSVGWLQSDIAAWLDQRVKASRNDAA